MKLRLAAAGIGMLVLPTPVGCDGRPHSVEEQDAASIQPQPAPADAGLSSIFRETFGAVGPPKAFIMAPGIGIPPEDFLRTYAPRIWGLTPADELVPVDEVQGAHDYITLRYRQMHRGVSVRDASLSLDVLRDHVEAGSASLIAGIDIDPTLKITEAEARQKVVDGLSAIRTKRDKPGELMILPKDRRLVWRFLVAIAPDGEELVHVDASTGAIVSHWSAREH